MMISKVKLVITSADTESLSWVASLPEAFEQHGLGVVKVDTQRVKEQYSRMFTEMDFVLLEEVASNSLDRRGTPGDGDKMRQLVQRAHQEVKQGSSISTLIQVVVGRKAP